MKIKKLVLFQREKYLFFEILMLVATIWLSLIFLPGLAYSGGGNQTKDLDTPTPFVKDGKWGYCNKEGDIIIKPQFDAANTFSEGRAAVKKGGLWGYIDKTGKIVIKPRFDEARDFHSGKAWVMINKLRGAIGLKGDYIIRPKWRVLFDDDWDNYPYDDMEDFEGIVQYVPSSESLSYVQRYNPYKLNTMEGIIDIYVGSSGILNDYVGQRVIIRGTRQVIEVEGHVFLEIAPAMIRLKVKI